MHQIRNFPRQQRLPGLQLAQANRARRFKEFSDTYHPSEPREACACVSAFRLPRPRETSMFPTQTDALTCMLGVNAAVLVAFAKCVGCTSKFP